MKKRKTVLVTVATGVCLICISTAVAQNLIVNGDFNTGNLSGWTSTAVAPTTITFDGATGNPSGSAFLARNDSTATANGNYLYQIIPVLNGAQYKLSAQWKGDLLNGGTGRNWAEVYINFTDTNTTFSPGKIYYKKATDGGPNDTPMPWDWESITASPDSSNPGPTNGVFTATGNYMTIAFNLGGRAQTSNNTQPGYYWVDNVSVTPWPPASTLVFTNAMRSGSDIVLQGKNGPANGAYEVLRSTDLSAPVASWPGAGIRSFDGNGSFSFTNPIPADLDAAFYQLHVVSSVPVFPPVITTPPQDVATSVGDDATFNVTATGSDLTYYWYYNTNTLLASGASSTLTLTNVQVSDSGKISVTVSNLLGTDQSTFATLTVTNSTEPPSIVTQPAGVNAAIGQTVNFSVTATGALPLYYQWYYNTNTVLTGETNATLTLNNVQLADAGNYSVTITNLYGSTNSTFASLTIATAPPTITAQPGNLALAVGQTANFSVAADGASPLHYQWYYNTNTTLPDETNSTLTLLNLSTNQAGKYSVTITNLYGSTNSTFATLSVSQALLAFPEAEGYGKYTSGGRGGAVYEVTNLNDSGPGSLRAAVQASGARTVVFRVGGTIFLNSNLEIKNPNITIAGQTAPGGGICIANFPLEIAANNVIIRYIRSRLGDLSGVVNDAMGSRFTTNLIVDHVSASWSIDETMSIYHCDHMTVQWCLIAESLYNSYHLVNGTTNQYGAHGFGGIWGSDYSTYHHNLFADHSSRNPRFASGCGHTDYRNNVIYNWGYNSCYGGEQQQPGDTNYAFSTINMVANYYKPGPATQPGSVTYRIANPSYRTVKTDYGQWYVASNVMVGSAAVTADNWNGGVQPAGGSGDIPLVKLTEPWPAMPINQQTAAEAYTNVLNKVGDILPQRDSEDTRLIQETTYGTNTFQGIYSQVNSVPDPTKICGIIDSQTDVGGWPVLASGTPPVDSDHDGMPDAWEIAHGLNPNDPSDRNTIGPDGYTHLEEYLNELGAF